MKLFFEYFLFVSITPPPPFFFLSACLLYSRLVLNLQKFIRYKLLLPSYSFIAPHRTESSFLLSPFLLPHCCFYDSRRAASSNPHPSAPASHPLSPPPTFSPFSLSPFSDREFETPRACGTSCSSRAVCFRVRK